MRQINNLKKILNILIILLDMQNSNDLPNTLPVFPLSNFIIFPETTVPLNIFEPRYIQMIDDCMKSNRMLGMVQPKKTLKMIILNYLILVAWEKSQVFPKPRMEDIL